MKKKALREENVERDPFCILHFSSANAIIYFDLLQENEADTHTVDADFALQSNSKTPLKQRKFIIVCRIHAAQL